MQKRVFVWMGCMCTVVVACALMARAQTQKTAWTPPPFKPVTTVHDMMEGQEIVFDGIKAAIKSGKWGEARHQTSILAELANVNVQQGKEEDYGKFARDMSERCVDLARVLRKRNAEEAKKAVSAVARTCQTCHDQYRKEH